MAFEIRQGSRGPTALWNGKSLTSAYDPLREAQTWANHVSAGPGSLVFVAGDPWGLGCQALKNLGIRAIALLPDPQARPWVYPGVEAWAPGEGSLEDYLHKIFDHTGPDSVVWEVWPAFERHANEVVLDWTVRFRDLYRIVQGSWLTNRRSGPRFWKNAVRNFLDWEIQGQLVPGDKPLVIAASGPSLNDGLEVLAQHRDRFDLWALPSSFETLVCRGLAPDAGVATDGGFYAREHLQRLGATEVPLLVALSSAPDPVLKTRRCAFFSQGLAVERALLGGLGSSFLEVPSQGTVAVTALRLALEFTTGPVFIAGLDLAFRDVRGHTSPHTVDRRFEALHHRLNPGETQWIDRLFVQAPILQGGVRTSPAMLTYAGWFRSQAQFSRSVHRIGPSPIRWPSMTEVGWNEVSPLWSRGGTRSVGWGDLPQAPSRKVRRETLLRALEALDHRARKSMDDPWLMNVARTAVPEALEAEFKAHRVGTPPSDRVQSAFLAFLADLKGVVR